MRTVQELIDELRRFPPGARCWAYEGEGTGIVVDLGRTHGFVHCGPSSGCEPDSEEVPASEPPQVDAGPFGPVSDWLDKVPTIKRESLGTWRAGDCAACEGSGWATWADRCEECNGTGRARGADQ